MSVIYLVPRGGEKIPLAPAQAQEFKERNACGRVNRMAGGANTKPSLIFDKGNNSADNFRLIDRLELPFVRSSSTKTPS